MPIRKKTTRKTGASKRTTKKPNTEMNVKVDPTQVLLKNRELYLFKAIDDNSSEKLIKDLRALDIINNKPIKLFINSPGGSVPDTFAIINTIKSIKSKVITIINSYACSGAALISISGDERYIVGNGVWMSHDMKSSINQEYSAKIEDRADYLKYRWKQIAHALKTNTALTTREINRARSGELWLFAEDALERGVVDKIISDKNV